MDDQQLIDSVKILLKKANLSPEENDKLSAEIDASSKEQLEELHDNLIQQIAANIYFEYLKKIEKDDQLLTEEEIDDLMKQYQLKLAEIDEEMLADHHIDKIRKELSSLSQKKPN